jgi:hypothetical protein
MVGMFWPLRAQGAGTVESGVRGRGRYVLSKQKENHHGKTVALFCQLLASQCSEQFLSEL